MIGAVWYGARDLRVEEVPDPEAGPGQVVIAVSRNGICGSDLHTYLGASMGGAALHVPGVVLGHEFAGTVVELGDGVDDLSVGTAVAVAPIEWCGSCWSCRHGHPNICRSLAIYGGYRRPLHGGLAERAVVSRRAAFEVPAGLDVVQAALAEPVAVALHAIRLAPVTVGSSVLVLGAGPVGLAAAGAAAAAGADPVVVSEPAVRRRTAAQQMGLVAVDPGREDLREVVRSLTGGTGLDIAVDTTAVSAAFNAGLEALRPHGTMVSVGGWSQPAEVNMGLAMAKELTVRYTMTYDPEVDFPAALALLARKAVDPDVMISDHIALADVVELGIDELLHHTDQHLKILVDPGRR